jgi:riboflavin kinase/FMN adenylyltransferase
MGARFISVGYNHHFGRDREGNPELLRTLGADPDLNFAVRVAPMVFVDGIEVSSSRIRENISAGNMEMAARLLSRPYAVLGEVIAGEKRGRKLGFPTANLLTSEVQLLPARGVYAGRARIIDGVQADCASHSAVVNVGYRPTFSNQDDGLLVEIHLLDFDQDIYGKKLQVEFLQFLRPEQKFDGIESLCAQITSDCAKARDFLRDSDQTDQTFNSPESKLPA